MCSLLAFQPMGKPCLLVGDWGGHCFSLGYVRIFYGLTARFVSVSLVHIGV